MFRYNVCGENIEVIEVIWDYVEKKVGKLERYFSDLFEVMVYVNLKVYIEKIVKVEVIIFFFYLVLWVEEMLFDLYVSIDLVVDKLEW